MDASKESRKQRIYNDFKNQEAFLEGMHAVAGDQPVYNPRMFDEPNYFALLAGSLYQCP